jgi:ABC-type multidrug transport system ATPase subunit
MHAVRLQELTKGFHAGFWLPRPRRAVDGVTLDVASGEVLGYLGPNGSGKTTTMKLLMQLIYQTSASAEILGRPAGRPAWSRVSPTPFDPDGPGVAGIHSFAIAERAAARGDSVIT